MDSIAEGNQMLRGNDLQAHGGMATIPPLTLATVRTQVLSLIDSIIILRISHKYESLDEADRLADYDDDPAMRTSSNSLGPFHHSNQHVTRSQLAFSPRMHYSQEGGASSTTDRMSTAGHIILYCSMHRN